MPTNPGNKNGRRSPLFRKEKMRPADAVPQPKSLMRSAMGASACQELGSQAQGVVEYLYAGPRIVDFDSVQPQPRVWSHKMVVNLRNRLLKFLG